MAILRGLTEPMRRRLLAHADRPHLVEVHARNTHQTTMALIGRGLLKYEQGGRYTSSTADGRDLIRQLLEAEADELAGADA